MNDKIPAPVRLIDANALAIRMQSLKEKYTHKNELLYTVEEKAIAEAIKLLESAPTVETTDDVLDSLPTEKKLEGWIYGIVIEANGNVWYASYQDNYQRVLGDIEGTGKTPLEAALALKKKLNSK